MGFVLYLRVKKKKNSMISCTSHKEFSLFFSHINLIFFSKGVGGLEAEAVMCGQEISMVLPQVVGFELKGKLPSGATSTDLVLTVTEVCDLFLFFVMIFLLKSFF